MSQGINRITLWIGPGDLWLVIAIIGSYRFDFALMLDSGNKKTPLLMRGSL
jgi:hypothetical protein